LDAKGARAFNEEIDAMFREMSQQLNFAATVSVLVMALFALTMSVGQAGGGVVGGAEVLTISAPVQP
jgi:hypothetical protein